MGSIFNKNTKNILGNDLIEKINQQYSPEYIEALEIAYGSSYMSEGQAEGIAALFHGVDLEAKALLDIGSGLGGAALWLAKAHNVKVSGLECNPELVHLSSQRTPPELQDRVSFHNYEQAPFFPFPNQSFDVVYSKGVITHIPDKDTLFQEIKRVLKPDGKVIIVDWLSPQKVWGPRMNMVCNFDGLALFPETTEGYQRAAQHAGLGKIEIECEADKYLQWNRDIAKKFREPSVAKCFIDRFGENDLCRSSFVYDLIADAIEEGELLVKKVVIENASDSMQSTY